MVDDIVNVITPYLRQSFFSVNVISLREHLLNQPWVQSVEVERVWPDGLKIQLKEKVPLARWGQASILTQDASLAPISNKQFKELPYVEPTSQPERVVELLPAIEVRLASIQLKLASLQLDAQDDLTLVLNDQVQVNLGSNQQLLRMDKFIRLYPQLFAHAAVKPKLIDLRYYNGLAVEWNK
jgi:cell division protein FtsQ